MERNIKVPFQGTAVDGEDMDFKTIREEWNEYQTGDGSTIRVKLVLTNIVKLKDKYDPVTGDPIYFVRSSNVLSVSASEKSKKGSTVS
jgi:hypothetical protein